MSLRELPSVDSLAASLVDSGLPRPLLVDIARRAIESARAALSSGDRADAAAAAAQDVEALLARRGGRMINASGVLLHTNLGRALLHPEAVAAAAGAASGYTPLEMNPSTGRRGGRGMYLSRLITAVTGAEDSLVVNNNAAALLLALAALARGGAVAVSRGELIEIGGSFRLPELMAVSGARLLEVGTTNRTRLSDYAAVAGHCSALLKVHPANYRIEGFEETTGYAELAELATESGIPFIADVGSGLLDARAPWWEGTPPPWLAGEPGVVQTLAAGAGVVLFSGDKLFGGPQAGIAVGKRSLIEAMRRHPLARAVRCDGPTLAAAAATAELYATNRAAEIPFWSMAAIPDADLEPRVAAVATAVDGSIEPGMSVPGAGSVPGRGIPTPIARIRGKSSAWASLLANSPPILSRRDEGDLLLDLRAVAPADDRAVIAALIDVCRS